MFFNELMKKELLDDVNVVKFMKKDIYCMAVIKKYDLY